MFSLVEIFIKLRRCHLQLDNLKKLIFVSKNQPNDLIVSCKFCSSLIEFIGKDVNLEEELGQFEKGFEKDENCGYKHVHN